ncbi:CsbA family protein [Staphylococcus capitis]|uniref:CsbA family protein n=1 Tax=Staphylococcus capitis TaxID=29388 RepID=UPI001BCA6F16|nr:CsbA family protein [Staphylococcus capitis]MCC0829101.1 CsbA family protein [Staphylococcus capitis]MCC9117263.1 CsbA family protein [Staphylococcus capitis]MCC9143403.1 CsbA family protein [Staphylococcus capitis]
MIWYACAAFFPCILVVLFSVVTRSKWIGTLLTLILIGTSIYKGFFHNEWIIFIDAVSLLAGYLIIDKLKFHKNQDDSR